MSFLLKVFTGLVSAMVFVVASVFPSFAQDGDVRIMVPQVPGGVIVSNCYQSAGTIYDGYTFSFCLKQRGTYSVRGKGLRCDGRLDWDISGLRVDIDLQRTTCNRGTNWTADDINCRPNILLGIIAALLKQQRPMLDNLNCTYIPARGTGWPQTTFRAKRQ